MSAPRTACSALSWSTARSAPPSSDQLLGLTPAAVRRHLDILSRDGVIEVKLTSNPRTGAGRPARRYVLSKRGQSELGDDYLEIARTALSQLSELGGEAAVKEFAANRFAQMERRYQSRRRAGRQTTSQRGRTALAGVLSGDGFVASSASVSSTSALSAEQLCQGHCPVQELASEFPQFCEAETADVLAAARRGCAQALHAGQRRPRLYHPHTNRQGRQCRSGWHSIPAGTAAPMETEVSNHQQERP